MRLSIIIPAYNSERYIIKTIESLAKQTTKAFEVIVVDDGSTDDTYNIAKNMIVGSGIEKYEIIKKENGGVSSARNAGISASSGDYIIFLDSDDYVSEKLVESIYTYLDENKHDIISWGVNEVRDDGTQISNYFTKYGKNSGLISGVVALEKIFVERTLWLSMGGAAYKKEFLDTHRIEFIYGCNNGEDIEFNYKALARAKHVYVLDKILLYYVQREGSLSKTYNLKKLDAIYAIERAAQYMEEYSEQKLEQILQIIRHDEKIKIYLNFVQSVLKNDKQINVKKLFHLINDRYFGLNEDISVLMKEYKGNDNKLKMKTKFFLLSPTLYTRLLSFKNRNF